MIKLINLFANRIFLLLKILSLFLIAFIVPKFFLLYSKNKAISPNSNIKFARYKLGLENIPTKLLKNLTTIQENKKKLRVGLITNQTGTDQSGNRNIDLLAKKDINIKVIYAPEHGITGKEAGGYKINDEIDPKTKIIVKSLYQGNSQFTKLNENDLNDIDLFIFDIQDSGIRHYTYISILYKMMELAAEYNKRIIVLDRPNPLGYLMEGSLVNPEFLSFISIAAVPLRHALTIGEIAKYFNKFQLKKPAKLIVVPMKDYQRNSELTEFQTFLSPNIKNKSSCFGYSFLGILGNIHPFEIGIGTDEAFQYILLPMRLKFPTIKWYELRNILASQNIQSTIQKYTKKSTGEKFLGLKIKINDINNFSSLNTLLDIIEFFKNEGIKFSFSNIFNKLAGTKKLKDFIEDKITRKELAQEINKDLNKFYDQIKSILIYKPLPKIVYVKY